MLNCATLILAASAALGQTAPTASFEDFQYLGDWMVGTTEAQRGDATFYVHGKWDLDKHAIIGTFSTDKEGKDVFYRTMTVWDGAAKQIRMMGVTKDGVVVIGTWRKADNVVVLEFESIQKDGTKRKRTASYKNDGTVEMDGEPNGTFRRITK